MARAFENNRESSASERKSLLLNRGKLEGFFAFFEHPMAEDGVGIGKNRRGLHGSLAAQPKAVNGSGRNHDARLAFNFIFFFTDADETFAFHIEEHQDFLSIMRVKGRALLTFEIMQPDG